MRKIKNMTDLTNDLVDVYEKLKAGHITTDKAKEQAKVAGKVIGSVRIQMEYNAQMKNNRTVSFLES